MYSPIRRVHYYKNTTDDRIWKIGSECIKRFPDGVNDELKRMAAMNEKAQRASLKGKGICVGSGCTRMVGTTAYDVRPKDVDIFEAIGIQPTSHIHKTCLDEMIDQYHQKRLLVDVNQLLQQEHLKVHCHSGVTIISKSVYRYTPWTVPKNVEAIRMLSCINDKLSAGEKLRSNAEYDFIESVERKSRIYTLSQAQLNWINDIYHRMCV